MDAEERRELERLRAFRKNTFVAASWLGAFLFILLLANFSSFEYRPEEGSAHLELHDYSWWGMSHDVTILEWKHVEGYDDPGWMYKTKKGEWGKHQAYDVWAD
jgi:hypothetical protein